MNYKHDAYYFWDLPALIEDLCENSGLKPNEFIINRLNEKVKGLVTAGNDPASTSLQALAISHFFDVASYNGRIHFVGRGGEPALTIPMSDLIEGGILEKRGEIIEVPMQLNIEYFDIEGGLNSDLQTSSKAKDTRAFGDESFETSEIMTNDEAKIVAVKQHKLYIENQRGEVEFELPKKYISLTVGDVVILDEKRLRIEKIELDLLTQKYTCKYDRKSAYQTSVKGIPVDKPTPPPENIVGEPYLEIFDSHILSDEHDTLGLYAVVQRSTDAWTGVLIEISNDGGENWNTIGEEGAEGIMGKTVTKLNAHSKYFQDKTNKFQIELYDHRDEVDEYTHRQVLNRNGMLKIGNEIINYEDAEYLGSGIYEFSNLLRGRKGTDAVEHEIGTRVVFLSVGAVRFYEMSVSSLNRTALVRATAIGTTSTSTTVEFTFKGLTQKELAPARFKARREGSDLHLSWIGVGRIGGGGVVRHGDYFLGYNIFVNDDEPIFAGINENSLTIPYQSGVVKICGINSFTGNGFFSEVIV